MLADGRVISTGTRARKSSAGYDLTRLFVGSEGTLGVITEVTLRLHPVPEAVSAAVCSFESMRGAVDTVIATIQLGVPVARIELLDEAQMDAVNRYSKTAYPVAPTLFFEFHGDSDRHVAEQAESRGGDRRRARRPRLSVGDAARGSRAAVAGAPRRATTRRSRSGRAARSWTTDVCVPISRLADCVVETKQDHAHAPFPICLVGHAGDGNFHLIYSSIPRARRSSTRRARLNERLVARALAMGGTCTGEHGVGYGKMKFLEAEHGAGLDVMRAIKRALDPDNRMNPGKVVDI